ncbi:hypothetical protein P3X46_027388 [Hevea brasiliensis]|uniref:F-box domain-containing protein n=1 Tax=Hevea brasiliensis TaxID=3981 RepID=A0ABQ9KZP1_HEVBR|nr:hypothetical protein P3X46_027388 [Hevea brasiliensis]
MERRKWEDLEMNCLMNVLQRVGMESLLLDVPFVCKSWCKASLDPLCWESLNFPPDLSFDRFTERFMDVYRGKSMCLTAFTKLIIDHSHRKATLLSPPYCFSEEECPALTTLDLQHVYLTMVIDRPRIVEQLIGKWRNLKELYWFGVGILGVAVAVICNLKSRFLKCVAFRGFLISINEV